MAVAFHASATGTVHAPASGASLGVAKPTVSSGDVLLIEIGVNDGITAGTPGAPAGWTLVGSSIASTKARTTVWWALQSVASVAFTAPTATGTQDVSWTILSFSGVDNTTPIDATGTGSSNTGANSISVATFNTATDLAMEVFAITDFNSGGTFTQSSFNVVASSNTNCQTAMCYAKSTTTPAGATGAFTVTDSAAASGNILCYQQFALRPAAGGATAYTRSVSDNLGLTDSESTLSVFKRVYTDNLGITDTIKRLAPTLRILGDNLGLTDTISRVSPALRNSTDNLGVTDSESTHSESSRINADNVGVTDTVSRLSPTSRVISDNLGASDVLSRIVESLRTILDNTALSDSKATKSVSLRATSDTLGLSDSAREAVASLRAVTDSIGISDTVSRLAACLRALSDNLGIQDITRLFGPGGHTYLVSVADNIGFSDVSATASALLRLLSDTLGATDTTARSVSTRRLVSDTLGISDTLARAVSTLLKIADTLGLTDIARTSKFLAIPPTIFLLGNAQTNTGQVGIAQRNVAPTANGQTVMALTASAEVGP